MKRAFSMIVERDEDGWLVGSIPELPGCHTQSKTMTGLKRRMAEAIALYLEAAPGPRPPGESEFVGILRVEVTA